MKDFREAIAKSRKLALYAHMTMDDFFTVCEYKLSDMDARYRKLPDGELREITHDGYVRISEPVAVAFAALNTDEVVQRAVESLEEQANKVRTQYLKEMALLNERKSQLLALTYQPDSAPPAAGDPIAEPSMSAPEGSEPATGGAEPLDVDGMPF